MDAALNPIGPERAAAVAASERLGEALAALLNTSIDKLPADLGQVGQELAFQMATDPSLHRRFSTGVVPTRTRHDRRSAVLDMRDRLITKGVSRALGTKLRTGR